MARPGRGYPNRPIIRRALLGMDNIVVAVPLGTAAAAGYGPVEQVTVAAPLGTASAAGFAPSTALRAPLGTATAAGFAPGVHVAFPAPLGTAAAAGYGPGTPEAIRPPLGTASAAGFAPSIRLAVAAPAGTASATGFGPTTAISAPLGLASATGYAPALSVALSPPEAAAAAYGFTPTIPIVIDPLIVRITATVHGRDGTLLAGLAGSQQKSWQDQKSDVGGGSFVLQTDDTDVPLIPYRSFVRFALEETPWYQAIIENRDKIELAPGEEHDETVTYKGRGAVAVWEEACVYPYGGVGFLPFTDTRLFSFASPEFDDGLWSPAVELKLQTDPTDPYSGSPAQWPPSTAWWIWGVGGAAPYPVGVCYFRKTFTLAVEGTVRFFASADDAIEVYVDGGMLVQDNSAYLWGQTKQQDIFLSAGTHTVAIKGTNVARPGSPSTNVAGVILAAFAIAPDGTLGTELLATDSTWACAAYPSVVPGFTPGQILSILMAEATARPAVAGHPCLEHVAIGFDAVNDSNGAPWDAIGEYAVPVGTDMVTVLQQLAESWIDFRMDPTSLTLYAYKYRTGTRLSVPALEPGVNLTSLQYQGVA